MAKRTQTIRVVVPEQLLKDARLLGVNLSTAAVAGIGAAIHEAQPQPKSTGMQIIRISIPKGLKDWIDGQVSSGRYVDASDYIRDLIRREQDRLRLKEMAPRQSA